jgi:hypothetical protein
VDPLADVQHSISLSPYHFVANNPVNNIDPDGLDWYRNNESGEVHWQEGSDELDGHFNIGAEYIMEGTKDFIVHNQNEVVSTISKSSLESVDQSNVMAVALVTSSVLLADDATVIGVVDDIAIPVILAGAATYELTQITYVTYTLTNPTTGQVYSGRSSGYTDPY